MAETLNLIVAHGKPDVRDEIRKTVQSEHTIGAECASVSELHHAVSCGWPDLIITGVEFPDGDGLDAVIRIGLERPLPTVVVTSKRSFDLVEKAMQDHVMAYLIEPVQADDLSAAILLAQGRFEQLQELTGEVDDLRQALEDRKFIERAKGILMGRKDLSEADAFAALRTEAQNERVKLIEIAQRILAEQG